MAFKFEELRVWQKALDIADAVHMLSRSFPKDELFILTSQIKRETDSISLNISEGSTGQTNPEFNRFLGISLRSAIEVVGCLHLAKRRKYINEQQYLELYEEIEALIVSIQSLRNTLKVNHITNHPWSVVPQYCGSGPWTKLSI